MKHNNGLEIGASDFAGSYIIKNYLSFNNATLIEPNIILYNDLINKTYSYKNIQVKNLAVSDYDGEQFLYHIGRSSFLKNSKSFINLMSKSPWEGSTPEYYLQKLAKTVKVINIKSIKLEDFDFISISCNGSELEILKEINRFPKYIRCTFNWQNQQQREYSYDIIQLLRFNGYNLVENITNKTQTFNDTIFQKL